MKRSSIKEEILREAYLAWEEHTNCFLDQLRDEHGWEESDFNSVVKELEAENLIRHHAQWDYRITARGIGYAEEQRIVPSEKSRTHKLARKQILSTLAEIRRKEGEGSTIYYQKLCDEAKIDEELFLMNERYLCDLGYIETRSGGHYRITEEGLRRV
jgi:predicted transcriptional regulator